MANDSNDAHPAVNAAIYDTLGERWYTAQDDPVALLRAEGRAREPWILEHMRATFGPRACAVLDVGCGAGFLTNALVRKGHDVTGVDASVEALAVAAAHDGTGRARYARGDALALSFADESFDVVCAMDLLEHVERPALVIAEAGRVLRPGGLFFFHTFNRNALAWLVVIKGVEWFVRNTPPRMHVLRLFIKPAELEAMCRGSGLRVESIRGLGPDARRLAFWRMLRTGVVGDDVAFRFTRSTWMGYTGVARKRDSCAAP